MHTAILFSALLAQPTVAPTDVNPNARGEAISNGAYTLHNTFETGYRFADIDGNRGKYRSDVNFRNGIRLLGSGLTIYSKEGKGGWLDELTLHTQGLGNDPYQSVNFRLAKNKLYRYDLSWRENAYFNPGFTFLTPDPRFLHQLDTTRRMQDHQLTLLPQGAFQFFVGYSRNTQNGLGLSTIQLFDSRGNDFDYFSDIRRRQSELRFGGEVKLADLKFFWQRGYEWFQDDPREFRTTPSDGFLAGNATRLTSFSRGQPWRGYTPTWRLNLLTERRKLWALNARFTHVDGQRNFVLDERAVGTGRFNAIQNRQFLLFGDGRRPVTTGNLTFSLFPIEKLSISNHSAVHSTRMEGNSSYREFNNSTLGIANLDFQFLGVRAFTNTTDVNYAFSRRFSVFSGYQYSTRRIRSIEQNGPLDGAFPPDRAAAEQTNRQHAGLFGVRMRPVKPLQINLDAEIGRADRPFYTVSERNYHALGARVVFKHKTLQINAQARNRYNFNSVSLFSHSSRGRHYGVDASWTPRKSLGFDGGYTKTHLDTLTGLAYFANGAETSGQSIYISNVHATYANVRLGIRDRADVIFGYSRIQDTGDGRPALAPNTNVNAAFLNAQTFPLSFHSPQARVSVKVLQKLRWNFGYQYYGYDEKLALFQDYRAHTGFTSLLWSF